MAVSLTAIISAVICDLSFINPMVSTLFACVGLAGMGLVITWSLSNTILVHRLVGFVSLPLLIITIAVVANLNVNSYTSLTAVNQIVLVMLMTYSLFIVYKEGSKKRHDWNIKLISYCALLMPPFVILGRIGS
jgi:ABC-type antimicrobial peptide transport system permease subunit